MTAYHRARIPGGSYFFTVAIAQRRTALLTENIDVLRASFREVRERHPFTVDAIAVLPDHLHCVWTLPKEDADYSTRWFLIKAGFSRRIAPGEGRRPSRIRRGERGLWQRRFWEHVIRDDGDYARHVDYIHFNPVKHGYVERVRDWPHSSFHRWVRQGVYPLDWASPDEIHGLDLE